jgi:hypothetical protein
MYKNRVIRNLTAGAMLVLFALSITPKQFLHNVITGHKHSYLKSGGTQNLQAAKNNFQCNWNEELIISPFLDEPDLTLPQPVLVYASYTTHYTLNYFSTEVFFSSLRGPPSQA